MAEERVKIAVQNGEAFLEGLWEEGAKGRNVVLCHPHPLYGGDMHNEVVQVMRRTFAMLGWTTLRFNFRAGGAAQGKRDALDLLDVATFLHSRSAGPIDLAGYSYGAWAAMEAVQAGLCPDSLVLIAPPLDFLSFEGLKPLEAPTLITLGESDEFCSQAALSSWLSTGPHPNLQVEILPSVDHFYRGAERDLSEKIKVFLDRLA